jgi:Domain of unknown function (DUF1963)
MTAGLPNTLLPKLEELLSSRSPEVSEAIRRTVTDVRPCVMLETSRAGQVPTRGKLIDRLLGKPPPTPLLSTTTSKFGGVPYVEGASDLSGGRFIGQVNFAEATNSLVAQDCPIPAGMPSAGLLAVDLMPGRFGGRVRWYPEPKESKAVHQVGTDVVGKYEASIEFRGGWSARGLNWFDAVPENDSELWNYMNDLEVPRIDEDARRGHKLFGHANEALNDHYPFTPSPGRSQSIRDYALIWRITYDDAAEISWGTNWLYAVVHRDDLAQSAFERAVLTGANA